MSLTLFQITSIDPKLQDFRGLFDGQLVRVVTLGGTSSEVLKVLFIVFLNYVLRTMFGKLLVL